MKNLLNKELHLSAARLSYFFLASSLLTFVPGYPILLGGFFTALGIFYSFQAMRENHDIDYSLLLPVSKADIVKSKFAFCVFMELCSFLLMTVVTILRMTALKDSAVYRANALMGANLVFLGYALILFGLFNFCFLRGFFKTGYYFGKPFVLFCVCAFLLIIAAEVLYHVPGLGALNSFGAENLGVQFLCLGIGIVCYVLLTLIGMKSSIRTFEKIDL
ncbi:MAG: ABC-2 transporter permease [Oscillospiraceae bacterium]|nr:ABC-2 transporter permease [Oscillospiraceae bacterium]